MERDFLLYVVKKRPFVSLLFTFFWSRLAGFWMSDKPLVQQALASELAEIMLTITPISSSLVFLRGFWEMAFREWSGIDRLRCASTLQVSQRRCVHEFSFSIDKFYMLIRRFVNASFRLLMRSEWDESACNEYNDILTKPGGPLWYFDCSFTQPNPCWYYSPMKPWR